MSRGRTARSAGAIVIAVIGIAVVIIIAAIAVITAIPHHEPLPGEQRCVATASGDSVALDTEQAHYAALIAGVSVRRGLSPRAASIALATAYQESGLRNLDHGDRDSVGLFQQRPSQGWGTKKQLTDPYFATRQFYRALAKVDGWQDGDITEVAQRIQVSGYPDAYRDHESDARILASVLTGQSPAGLSCLVRDRQPGDTAGLAAALHKTYGVTSHRSATTIKLTAHSSATAWADAHFAVANARGYGVRQVQVGDRLLTIGNRRLTEWKSAPDDLGSRTVKITVGASGG